MFDGIGIRAEDDDGGCVGGVEDAEYCGGEVGGCEVGVCGGESECYGGEGDGGVLEG